MESLCRSKSTFIASKSIELEGGLCEETEVVFSWRCGRWGARLGVEGLDPEAVHNGPVGPGGCPVLCGRKSGCERGGQAFFACRQKCEGLEHARGQRSGAEKNVLLRPLDVGVGLELELGWSKRRWIGRTPTDPPCELRAASCAAVRPPSEGVVDAGRDETGRRLESLGVVSASVNWGERRWGRCRLRAGESSQTDQMKAGRN